MDGEFVYCNGAPLSVGFSVASPRCDNEVTLAHFIVVKNIYVMCIHTFMYNVLRVQSCKFQTVVTRFVHSIGICSRTGAAAGYALGSHLDEVGSVGRIAVLAFSVFAMSPGRSVHRRFPDDRRIRRRRFQTGRCGGRSGRSRCRRLVFVLDRRCRGHRHASAGCSSAIQRTRIAEFDWSISLLLLIAATTSAMVVVMVPVLAAIVRLSALN